MKFASVSYLRIIGEKTSSLLHVVKKIARRNRARCFLLFVNANRALRKGVQQSSVVQFIHLPRFLVPFGIRLVRRDAQGTRNKMDHRLFLMRSDGLIHVRCLVAERAAATGACQQQVVLFSIMLHSSWRASALVQDKLHVPVGRFCSHNGHYVWPKLLLPERWKEMETRWLIHLWKHFCFSYRR